MVFAPACVPAQAAPSWPHAAARAASSCQPELTVLPKAHRLRTSDGFQRAIRSGVTRGRPDVVVHALDTGLPGPSQVGFVVGRRVGGAVVRNRVRRQLRHLAAGRVRQLPDGLVIVIRATPGAGATPVLADEFGACWDSALKTISHRRASTSLDTESVDAMAGRTAS